MKIKCFLKFAFIVFQIALHSKEGKLKYVHINGFLENYSIHVNWEKNIYKILFIFFMIPLF